MMKSNTFLLGEMTNTYKILIEKSGGKRPLGRHKRRWEVNFGMDLTEIEWESVCRIHLAQDRDQWRAVVNTVMNIEVP
jgi:hypothetical protein